MLKSIVRRLSGISRRAAIRAGALGALLAFAAGGAACGGGNRGGDSAVAGGDAAAEVEALNYEVTPDRYQRWVNAQRALDAISGLGEPPALDPDRFSDSDVDRAARYLESDARARAALERAGIGARDYVLTTLALDQALVASSGTLSGSSPAPRSAEGSRATSAPASGSGGARPRDGERGTAAPRPSSTPDASGTPVPGSRPRYRNVPPANREIVERNRDDIARVRTESRFRIVKERVDTAFVERPVEAAARGVPAGTTISLRSDSRVCTNTHKPGDRVTATVTAPVSSAGGVVIPAGASASLSLAGGARSTSQTAPMEFTLNSISVNGRTYSVAGTAVASRVDRVRAGSARRDAEKVVGGAAIGAVAGQVLGRDTKSTVVGAAVGAAAGAAAASASARYDACVAAGAPIQLTLRDSLDLRV